jgi:hypothetical protein
MFFSLAGPAWQPDTESVSRPLGFGGGLRSIGWFPLFFLIPFLFFFCFLYFEI